MSGGNRLHKAALGGCLAALLLATPALAQQEVEKPTPTVNEGQGVAGEAPAPEEDSGESAAREQTPPADPLPAPPGIENETDTEPACGPRCEAAQQRENSDLVAQESMADSTKEIAGLTEWQLYAGGVGILLLVGTLILTVKSTNAAVEANRIARESAERQLRAYVTVDTTNLDDIGGFWHFKIVWKNTGQTPAIKVLTHMNWEATTGPLPNNFTYPSGGGAKSNEAAALGAGQHIFSWPVSVPRETIGRVSMDIQNLYVWGSADYGDTFLDTPRRRTEFCYQIVVDDTVDGKIGIGMRVYGPHNGMDDGCHYKPKT